jgi:TPR repeat protein
MKIPGILQVLLLAFAFGVTGINVGQAVQTLEAEFLKTERMAEQGDAKAQFQLGAMYEYGLRGAPKDEIVAAMWYRRAAEQGDAMAQHSLGHMYQYGRGGLEQDEAKAAQWYTKAAAQGNLGAQKNLNAMQSMQKGEQENGQATPRRYSKEGPRGM